MVATPGRLVDHIDKTEVLLCLSFYTYLFLLIAQLLQIFNMTDLMIQAFTLDKVEWVVLDEADRMLELGYEREVTKVG